VAGRGWEHARGPSEPDAARPAIAAVLKAMNVIECFTQRPGELALRDLVKMTGYPTTTVHRLLSTLEQAGWVVRRGAGYVLSLRVAEIASHVLEGIDLREEARPLMRQLSQETGETTYLVMRRADHAVCVERVEGDRMVRVMAFDVGSTLPLHAGAAPLVLLAGESEAERNRLIDLYPLVLPSGRRPSKEELRARLAHIREVGWAVSAHEVVEGIASIGAAVFGADGRPVAAISVGGLATGFTPVRQEEIARLVVRAAEELSGQIGHKRGFRPA
jgi:DNA-binding IclR family transcriptional regulator